MTQLQDQAGMEIWKKKRKEKSTQYKAVAFIHQTNHGNAQVQNKLINK
jgi:hypothetical protein